MPDLGCSDISERDFKVNGSDPHRFDINNDGIGCESIESGKLRNVFEFIL
jgi:hypothetical protein